MAASAMQLVGFLAVLAAVAMLTPIGVAILVDGALLLAFGTLLELITLRKGARGPG